MTSTSYYNASYWQGKYQRPYERRRAQVIQAVYGRVPFQPGWLAVDLGAGSGFYAGLLEQRRARVIAADVDSQVLAQARREGVWPLVCTADDGRLPLREATCDFVNALDVLEHLREPLRLLDEIRRVLKVGGYALISTQNRDSLEGWTGRAVARLRGRRWTAWDDTHTHIFSYGELLGQLRCRFDVVEQGAYYFGVCSVRAHPLPPLIWQLSTRVPGLRRLGFTMMMVVRKHAL